MRRKDTTQNMTKGYMSQALLLLLERQPYGQITIGEITAKAGVDRSTYYRHFTCKEDIVRFYYNALMDECSRAFRKSHCTTFDSYMRIRFKILYLHKTDLLRLHRSNLTHLLLDVMMDRSGAGVPKGLPHRRHLQHHSALAGPRHAGVPGVHGGHGLHVPSRRAPQPVEPGHGRCPLIRRLAMRPSGSVLSKAVLYFPFTVSHQVSEYRSVRIPPKFSMSFSCEPSLSIPHAEPPPILSRRRWLSACGFLWAA